MGTQLSVYNLALATVWRVGTELTAIRTQQMLTYGLSRSPIRAHFQKIPNILVREYISICNLTPNRLSTKGTPDIPVLIPVHDTGHYRMGIATGANNQEEHKKQRAKVEKGRLGNYTS